MDMSWTKSRITKTKDKFPVVDGVRSSLKHRSHTSSNAAQSNGKENLVPKFDHELNVSNKKKHKRTASFTDLRPEDKKKVANLIQELANLGSEKDIVEACLKKERETFETAIKDLVDDQKALLLERRTVQAELNSCQQMLNQLQDVVLHRPMVSSSASSALSSQRPDIMATFNNSNADTSLSYNNGHAAHEKVTALEEYVIKHNSTQDFMEVESVNSEVESVTSVAARNPR